MIREFIHRHQIGQGKTVTDEKCLKTKKKPKKSPIEWGMVPFFSCENRT